MAKQKIMPNLSVPTNAKCSFSPSIVWAQEREEKTTIIKE
jgi:hypothetical protein